MCTIEKFNELFQLNVNEHTEVKRSGNTNLTYLSWAWAWAAFKKVYPNATYEVKKDENNRCFFGDEKVGYMVYTSVTAEDLTYEMWLPVMDGANKTMKIEPYTYKTRFGEKSVEAMSMFDVNKTVMRCLVKNLAMFGLGLYIYAGEDLPESDEQPAPKDTEPKSKATVKPIEPKPFVFIAEEDYRGMMIRLCKEKGIDPAQFAGERNITKATTPEQFKAYCEEIKGGKF